MSLATDLRQAAAEAERLQEKLERVSRNAYVLCRTLGYAHGESGAAFVGPPTSPGFVDTNTAIRQLLGSLGQPI